MFKNYLKIALRNIFKYKAYSFINIIGLSIGITACILILLFVNDELSFDKQNINSDKIYRVHTYGLLSGREINMAISPPPLGQALVKEFPEVVAFTRMMPNRNMLIRYKNNVFIEQNIFWADSGTFKVFTVPFLRGNADKALAEPHTVVLTEKLSKKYFGDEDPMDKIMNFEDGTPYTVRGVVADCPPNAHWHYDMFASFSSLGMANNDMWLNNNVYTYVLLKDNFSIKNIEDKIESFTEKHVSKNMVEIFGTTYKKMKAAGMRYEFAFQPLTDIHLNSHLDYEIEPNSDIKYVYIFSLIAIFILVLACINFMNLSTARASLRIKEVGVRKVLGSNKKQLITQFLFESMLITAIAILIAIVFSEMLLPLFNSISGKSLHSGYFSNYEAIPAIIFTVLFLGLLAGGYPAFFLSSFSPAVVLSSKLNIFKRSWVRSMLVVFQFTISIILLIGTFIVYSQMRYMQNKKLGFDKDHVLVIQRAWGLENNTNAFKEELLKNSGIVSVSNSDNLPGGVFGQTVFRTPGDDSKQNIFAAMSTDYDFAKTMGLELTEGRYFSRDFPADTMNVVINETAARLLGYKDPLGRLVQQIGNTDDSRNKSKIIGVLRDFHYESLHQKIRPLLIFLNKNQTAFLPVRISSNDFSADIELVKKLWKKFVPDKPLEYYFLNENFERLYRAEIKTGQIFTTFALISILIACLGLLGLASFTAERRTKEIGIRKVMGATTGRIIFLLSKEFIKWVLIANIIAWPLAYYFMNNWLQAFAYKINISIWIFPAAGFVAFLVALVTVSTQTLKASLSNPANALKYE
ncbi:MAG: ABC transporter permease [Ignavibacteriaceae bacterium]